MEKNILTIGSGTCPFCKKDNRVEVTPEELKGLDKWNKGEGSIQTVMPNLSASKREILMTGICMSCQDKIFGTTDPEPTKCDPGILDYIPYIPEPIEYDLGKIDYVLGEEENEVVEFVNNKTSMVLRLDYNLMTACKVSIEDIFCNNGNFKETDPMETRILEKYGFRIVDGYEDEVVDGYEDEEFDKGLYDEDYFDDDDLEFDFDDDNDDDLPF